MNKLPIVKTAAEIQSCSDYVISNSSISNVYIRILGHFGNEISLEFITSNGRLFDMNILTKNIGRILQFLVGFLGLSKEDGLQLSEIHNAPCRVITKHGCICGIGHFVYDQFVLEEELLTYFSEKYK